MFWNLFIFRGHSTREPASIVCNVALFYSAESHKNRCQPQPTQEKLGEVLEKMQMNGLEG